MDFNTRLIPENLSLDGFETDKVVEFWDVSRINKIRLFIRDNLKKTKTINRRDSSYGIKHKVERNTDLYITNGELIAAMILEGYRFKRDWTKINCNFNVSTSSLKKLNSYE